MRNRMSLLRGIAVARLYSTRAPGPAMRDILPLRVSASSRRPRTPGTLENRDRVDGRAGGAANVERVDGQQELPAALGSAGVGERLEEGVVEQRQAHVDDRED